MCEKFRKVSGWFFDVELELDIDSGSAFAIVCSNTSSYDMELLVFDLVRELGVCGTGTDNFWIGCEFSVPEFSGIDGTGTIWLVPNLFSKHSCISLLNFS